MKKTKREYWLCLVEILYFCILNSFIMRRIFLSLCFLSVVAILTAQNVTTEEFAVKDTNHLMMDVYQPTTTMPEGGYPCFIYVFGGGFKGGSRQEKLMIPAFQQLAQRGFVVVAIDYRLGLKGVTKMGVSQVNTLEHAIRIAVEDLYSATSYLCQNAHKFQINKDKIIISGGSAGAITALQADYLLHNQDVATHLLPADFRYAGVVSFSGAVFSRHGKVKYPNGNPAPTFILHGTEDRLVPYGQIEFANIGFYGSSKLVKRFEKYHFPYYFKRMKGYGHEVATLLPQMLDEIEFFYQNWVMESKPLQVDETWFDADYVPVKWGTMKPGDLYKK